MCIVFIHAYKQYYFFTFTILAGASHINYSDQLEYKKGFSNFIDFEYDRKHIPSDIFLSSLYFNMMRENKNLKKSISILGLNDFLIKIKLKKKLSLINESKRNFQTLVEKSRLDVKSIYEHFKTKLLIILNRCRSQKIRFFYLKQFDEFFYEKIVRFNNFIEERENILNNIIAGRINVSFQFYFANNLRRFDLLIENIYSDVFHHIIKIKNNVFKTAENIILLKYFLNIKNVNDVILISSGNFLTEYDKNFLRKKYNIFLNDSKGCCGSEYIVIISRGGGCIRIDKRKSVYLKPYN